MISKNLWLNEQQNRYFLVPTDQVLPIGSYTLQSLNGEIKNVILEAVGSFEVTEAEAKQFFGAEVGQVLENLREGLAQLGLGSVAQVRGLLQGIEGALNQDEAQLTQARAQMHHLREALQRQGIAVDDWLETLPDRLHQLQASIQGADRRDLAAQLQQWADLLEQPAEEIDLDRIVQLLETKLGGILGMEARKARREEEKRQEYRESARQAIARSLQKHGISPLTGSDVTPKEK